MDALHAGKKAISEKIPSDDCKKYNQCNSICFYYTKKKILVETVLDRRGKKCRMFSINRLKSRSNGPVAQLGERNVRNVEVRGSSLLRSISERFARMACKTFFYFLRLFQGIDVSAFCLQTTAYCLLPTAFYPTHDNILYRNGRMPNERSGQRAGCRFAGSAWL